MKVLRGALFLAAIATAQQHPNFSGTWNVNFADSDFSDKRASVPDRLVLTIQQKGDELKYHINWEKDGKKGHFEVDVTIGGSPYESNAAGIVSAAWKGDTLEIPTLFNPGQDRQSDQIQVWWLSPDGKKLTDDLTVHLPRNGGDVHVRRVFDKRP